MPQVVLGVVAAGGAQAVEQHPEQPVVVGEEHLLLVPEVPEEGALRDPRGRRHLVHRGGREAALGDLVRAGPLRPLDGVLANAGLQTTDRISRSAQGHELTFSVDVLAQHALLAGIGPVLAPDAHVLLLGSSTHPSRAAAWGLAPSPRWQDPHDLARPQAGPAGTRASAGAQAYPTPSSPWSPSPMPGPGSWPRTGGGSTSTTPAWSRAPR